MARLESMTCDTCKEIIPPTSFALQVQCRPATDIPIFTATAEFCSYTCLEKWAGGQIME